MTTVPCPASHAWVDVGGMVRNWTLDYDNTAKVMTARAFPMRRIAEAVNRMQGRYPAPRAMMGWPITAENAASTDTNGSAPLVNWATPDYVRNARTGQVRIATALRSDNIAQNCYAAMSHNTSEQTSPYTAWANAQTTNYPGDVFYQSITLSRGDETNTVKQYGLDTHGGYQVLDMIHQDTELQYLQANAAIHDHCVPSLASGGREVLSDLAEQIRLAFHRMRVYNHGFQTSWMGGSRSNALQYPVSTDAAAIIVTSNTPVNLINQAWSVSNSDSPGIECHARYAGRGHTGVASGTVVPCTVRISAEYNAAGVAGNAGINVVGPTGYVTIPIIANVGAASGLTYYAGNVGLNTLLDPSNAANGANKIDLFGWVSNSGTDSLIVRGIFAQTCYN